MKLALAAVIASCTLALAAGCGSSSASSSGAPSGSTSSSSSSGSTAATATAPKAAATSTSSSETLHGDTTPKFASPTPSARVQSGLVQIAYRSITIQPDTVRVKLGSTIRWTNYDSVQANVTSEGGPQTFSSKNFGEGGTFEIKAEKPGVIHYECTLYPTTMNGTIEVLS